MPYRFARSEVEVRLTPRTVEVFLKGERVAAHLRSSGNHRHTTVPEHMPSNHRRYADWTVERIRREAAAIGPATATLCELILEPPCSIRRVGAVRISAARFPCGSPTAWKTGYYADRPIYLIEIN